MTDKVIYEEKVTIGEDRVIRLPADAPIGEFTLSLKQSEMEALTAEEEAALDAEIEALLNDPDFGKGLGLTAEEIAKSPEIGMWKDRTDIGIASSGCRNSAANAGSAD